MKRFDLLGPLPAERSTTVLEASAGTGKTFALAGLVTRYLAEGAATLDQMLLITFSRAASQELRERVRRQIVDAVIAGIDRLRREDSLAYLLVEQHAKLALAVTERAIVLDRGEIVHAEASLSLLTAPDRLGTLMGVGARAAAPPRS